MEYVVVVNISKEVVDSYYSIWGNQISTCSNEEKTAEFIKLLYRNQGQYFLHSYFLKKPISYILFTGNPNMAKGNNSFCMLAKVKSVFQITPNPIQVLGKTYGMSCVLDEEIYRIIGAVKTRNYDNNVGSLQHRVLEFDSEGDIFKFLLREGATITMDLLSQYHSKPIYCSSTCSISGCNGIGIHWHHVIPKCFYKAYPMVYDPRNLIGLCPNCHNQIHNGSDAAINRLTHEIYSQQKIKLDVIEANITKKQLENLYMQVRHRKYMPEFA